MRSAVRTLAIGFAVLAIQWCAFAACADDAYYLVQLGSATFAEGTPPPAIEPASRSKASQLIAAMQPAVKVIGEGEAYVGNLQDPDRELNIWSDETWRQLTLAVKAPAGKDVTLNVALPKADLSGMERLKLVLPAKTADVSLENDFAKLKVGYYRRLAQKGIPGTAWFRHQATTTKLKPESAATDNRPRVAGNDWQRDNELVRQFSLFSGGRALAENLQLDRQIAVGEAKAATVDLGTLEGITVAEIDWKPLIKGLDPQLDPLAANIPADQHVVFFPSFQSMVKLADEARSPEASLLRSGKTRMEDAKSLDWYQQQLGISVDAAARAIGPKLVDSVALTGSDPYFPTGTDVAVLFATKQPAMLKGLLLTQMTASATKNSAAKSDGGEVEGISYEGFRSPDRHTSSYLAVLKDAVVVTNSLAQFKQLALVAAGKSESISSLDEYKFFRARYPLGDEAETAFVFLSDATIRRWCSPRWRIATARRTQSAAVLAELQAANFDLLATGRVKPTTLQSDFPLVNGGELRLTPEGVTSSVQGSLEWQTPIVELDMQRVSEAEAEGYKRWREQYQNNWRWAFDPIAIRLGASDKHFAVDLTVMPLIAGTDYREMINLSRGAKLTPESGDKHDALAHFVLAINKESAMFQQGRNMAQMFTPDPFGWLGNSVAVYVDDDPLWQELQKMSADEIGKQQESLLPRVPIALRAEVANAFKLTAFLATLRGFIDQAAPGMVTWENLTHRELPYVKISPTAAGRTQVPQGVGDIALFYAPSPTELVVSFNENAIKHSLERRADRAAGKDPEKKLFLANAPWLGENLGLQVNENAIRLISRVNEPSIQRSMQISSWSNLPILNEWKRRFPDQDPVALHEKFWHASLYCPGGGKYVWNEKWQTMESTAFGHPGEPKGGPQIDAILPVNFANFGLTFEEQGLRARVELKRPAKP